MSFFREVKEEIGKVDWPDSEELRSNTGTVFSTIALFAAFFFIVDQAIQAVIKFALSLR